MSPFQAAVLGMVQGLTEFLPISSSGHLILVPWLLGWPAHSLAFDAGIHLGTVAALVGYFWRDWLVLARSLLPGAAEQAQARAEGRRLLGLLLLGSLPAGVIGLAFESVIERAIRQPWLVALLLIAFGLLLLWADRRGARRRGLADVDLADVLVVGVAQALALAPGVSRSGITITAALLRGLERAAAARFSFLLSTPITTAAALYSSRKLLDPQAAGEVGVFLVGVVSAALFGLLAIGFLLRYLQRNSLVSFVWYRLGLGALVLVLTALGRPG